MYRYTSYQHSLSYQLKDQLTLSKPNQEYYQDQYNIHLQQRLELIESQLRDYYYKDQQNRRLNESIMMSYRQNYSIREQYSRSELNCIVEKHSNELKKIKSRHNEERNTLEDNLRVVKEQYEYQKIVMLRKYFEHYKEMETLKINAEQKLLDKLNEQKEMYEFKVYGLTERLKQAESMAQLYRYFVQKRRDMNDYSQVIDFGYGWQLGLYDRKNLAYHDVNHRSKPIRTSSTANLTNRINRVLVELQPNKNAIRYRIDKLLTAKLPK